MNRAICKGPGRQEQSKERIRASSLTLNPPAIHPVLECRVFESEIVGMQTRL
jgi:hypothetical protein